MTSHLSVRPTRVRTSLGLTALLAVVPLTAAAGQESAGSVDSGAPSDAMAQALVRTQIVDLRADEAPPTGGRYVTFVNSGTGAVDVSVATLNGGALTANAQRGGGAGHSIRTPAFNPAASAPRAVVRVRNSSATDMLDPQAGRFRFGADFTLDAESQSSAAGSIDNGDNLVQRGLFDDASQYKLQLDNRVPTCRIKGAAGAVEVSSTIPAIAPGRWYRVSCERLATGVTIKVTRWLADGSPQVFTDTAPGSTGDMTPSAASVPFSAGGKLTATGAVVASTDQFNGRIDNIVLNIG